jgi:hypothetical protein
MVANMPDPRLNAWRTDLAAASLRGRVEAARFVEGSPAQVVAAVAPLRRAPRHDAALKTEALLGEVVTVYEEREGWAWAQLKRDGYVGYMPCEAVAGAVTPVTHRVTALRTFVFPAPDIKMPPLYTLSLNAGLVVEAAEGNFLKLGSGGFVFAAHAAPAGETAPDFVAVAERFLGTPYLWGGRTSLGVDCSGLVQLALEAAGIAAPRDTDMQERAVGEPLPDPGDISALRRGDLLFWEGHVGIMADDKRLLHASAHVLQTVIEPVGKAVARIAKSTGPVRTVRHVDTGGTP